MIERQSIGGVTALIGERGGKYPNGNAVLVEDDVTVLIDPSINVAAAGRASVGCAVDVLVNTHAHEDHFAGNPLFEEAELLLHEADAPAMRSIDALMNAYGMPADFEPQWRSIVVEQFGYRERPDLRTVVDDETLDIGRHTLRFLHMPGHTAGHMCVEIQPEGVVVLGDLDMTWFGPYYGDANASLEQVRTSLARLAGLEGVQAMVSFHEAGVVREDVAGCIARYGAVLDERDERLLELCRRPATASEIADACIVYRKRYEKLPWQLHVEAAMMLQHAEALARQGRMRLEDGRWVTTD